MIDWPNAIAGALLGLALSGAAPSAFAVVQYVRNGRLRRLAGPWYFYHPSLIHASKFIPIAGEAKYAFWARKLSIAAVKNGDSDRKYNGFIKFGRGTLLVEIRVGRWVDPIRMVIPDDAQSKFEPAAGLLIGVDRNYVPVATEVVAARRPISDAELASLPFFKGKVMYGARP